MTDPASLFEARLYIDSQGKTFPYRLLKPENYDPHQAYALVLFLHGAGERGDDNLTQLRHCVAIFTQSTMRSKFPCFVVVPQCPAQNEVEPWGWTGIGLKAQPCHTGDKPGEPARLAIATVEAVQKEFNIDSKRLYISGISMGGFGTWDIVTRYPGKFAAAIPICGGGEPEKARLIAKFPVWAFHGADDPVVPVALTRNMIEAMKKAGGSPKYTEYPTAGHNSWDPAYSETELLPWLFAQKKASFRKDEV